MPYYRCPGCGITAHSAASFSSARACPHCGVELPRAARVYPGPTRHIRRVLAARPEAAAKARHAVRALQASPQTRDILEMLVSELVANSVLHAGLGEEDPVSVHVTSSHDRIRLSVRDSGPGFDPPSGASREDPFAAGGRGFVIVEALSDAWGIERAPHGCTVWCELTVDEHPTEAVDRQVTEAYLSSLAGQMA